MLDSMRIELDQPPVTWNQYFLQSTSSAPAAAKRYYFHKRAWINDADHICLAPLPVAQAQAAASLIALSGGNTISGDRLPDLDAVRLDILRKDAFIRRSSPAGRSLRHRPTLDVRHENPQTIWRMDGRGFSTSARDELERTVPLKRLWLDETQSTLRMTLEGTLPRRGERRAPRQSGACKSPARPNKNAASPRCCLQIGMYSKEP
jgi:hypothetical protein